MIFDDLGFATDYSVETEIEFPSDGDWGFPEVRVRANGLVFGGPLAVVRPSGGAPWVLVSDLQDIGTLYATPNPKLLCLVDQLSSVAVIDVDNPEDQTDLDIARPISIAGAPDVGFLLVGDDQRVTAFGVDGRGWQSEAIFDYDLRIRRTDNGRVVCRGWFHGATHPIEVTLDARTGEVIAS